MTCDPAQRRHVATLVGYGKHARVGNEMKFRVIYYTVDASTSRFKSKAGGAYDDNWVYSTPLYKNPLLLHPQDNPCLVYKP